MKTYLPWVQRAARWAAEAAGVGGLALGTWVYLSEFAGIAIGGLYLILLANRR